ncbi:MAG: hypothetical protein JSR90_06750 [Proteobacteria bacterium]|nr:hypothetical protein [Pseudomonadota bacterium]
MIPLVAIATSLIPDLIKILAGDKAGAVAQSVAEAVRTATGTDDPQAAKQKLDADPAAASELRIKLAQIALDAQKAQNDAEDRRAQNQLQELKAQLDAEAQRRQTELETLKEEFQAGNQNTAGARTLLTDLARQNSPVLWVSAILSGVVTLGFFGILVTLLVTDQDFSKNQMVNITIGALVAGFATVLNFWLGSSQGSREKDRAFSQVQAVQADQTAQKLSEQSKEIASIRTMALQAGGGEGAPMAKAAGKSRNFESCLQLILASEGGYSERADDGPTNFGITLATLREWRHARTPTGGPPAEVTADDVKRLALDEVREIYRSRYWNLLRCEDLPGGVDLVVFDFGVNAGPARAAMCLQQAVGTTQDGSIGPVTIAALGAHDPKQVIQTYSARRLEIYRTFRNFDAYGAGWTARISRTEQAALRMAGA